MEQVFVAHADLVAVVEDRTPGQRQQHAVEQLDPAAVAFDERSQPAADAVVLAHPQVGRVEVPHELPLLGSDHLEGQLVVVAEEDAPLALGRDLRGVGQDLLEIGALAPGEAHVEAGHHREVEVHVALVAIAEVGGRHRRAIWLASASSTLSPYSASTVAPHLLEEGMGLGEVLAAGALPLVEVGDGIHAEPVETHVEPEPMTTSSIASWTAGLS